MRAKGASPIRSSHASGYDGADATLVVTISGPALFGAATYIAMQWTDEGVVLGVRRHGETSVILELLTVERGRHLGLVRGGSRHAAARRVAARQFAARHLAGAARRPSRQLHGRRASICVLPAFLPPRMPSTASPISPLLCRLLAEREPHARIHAALEEILDALDDRAAVAPMIARFELAFLAELGFGLDLVLLRRHRRARTI